MSAADVRRLSERLHPDMVVTDRNISGLNVPRIRIDRSRFNVFHYGDSLRGIWLQMKAPANAGWMEAME